MSQSVLNSMAFLTNSDLESFEILSGQDSAKSDNTLRNLPDILKQLR